MRASDILKFQETAILNLRRPWQTFKDGQLWYGFTKTGSKRHPLTTKQGKHNFYKGTRSTGVGRLNKHGHYVMDWSKVRTYVVPSTINPDLKPLVYGRSPEIVQTFEGYPDRFHDGNFAWDNVVDFIEKGEGYSEVNLQETQYVESYVKKSESKAQQNENDEKNSSN